VTSPPVTAAPEPSPSPPVTEAPRPPPVTPAPEQTAAPQPPPEQVPASEPPVAPPLGTVAPVPATSEPVASSPPPVEQSLPPQPQLLSPPPPAPAAASPSPAPAQQEAAPSEVASAPSPEVVPTTAPSARPTAPGTPPSPDTVLGVAYAMNGTGLVPFNGTTRSRWEDSFTQLLEGPTLGAHNRSLSSPTLIYIGSVGISNGTASNGTTAARRLLQLTSGTRRRGLLQAATGVTVYYDIGNVEGGRVNATASALAANDALLAFRRQLVANGVRVSSIRLVATLAGGIMLPEAQSLSGNGGGLGGGAIAGIVIAVLVGIAAVLFFAYLCVWRSRKKQEEQAIRYVTPATPVGVRTAAPFNGSPMKGGTSGSVGGRSYSNNGSVAGATYPVSADTAFKGASLDGSGPSSDPGPKPNPAQRISSWWDERVRGQTTSNYGVRLGNPVDDDFDPYSANLAEATSSRHSGPRSP